jgi:vacuolar-type H+-ATPase subunit E/Vma4
VTLPDPVLLEALAPVRAALLTAARAEAEQTLAEADADAATTLATGRATAARIRAEARAQGAASGAAHAAAERQRAHRAARTALRRAQRDAYEQLRAAAQQAVGRLRSGPDYPALQRRLAAAVVHTLGDGAAVREAAGGGVVGEAPGRRVDWSLATFADRAVQAVAGQLTEGRVP